MATTPRRGQADDDSQKALQVADSPTASGALVQHRSTLVWLNQKLSPSSATFQRRVTRVPQKSLDKRVRPLARAPANCPNSLPRLPESPASSLSLACAYEKRACRLDCPFLSLGQRSRLAVTLRYCSLAYSGQNVYFLSHTMRAQPTLCQR